VAGWAPPIFAARMGGHIQSFTPPNQEASRKVPSTQIKGLIGSTGLTPPGISILLSDL
jgi:hypothetical protein